MQLGNRELNNTFVYDGRGYCDKTVIWNDLICEVRRGGLYKSDSSTTFVRHSDLVDAGGASIEAQLSGSELGIGELISSSVGADDVFALNQQEVNIANMPVGIPRFAWDHGYSLMHGMGLGRNSTLLNSLHSASKISSKVWSIFWGRMWVADAIDGSLVLGGYDADKVIGNNFTAPLDYSDKTGCWTGMKAQITGITLNNRNGTNAQLLDSSTVISACIVPQRQLALEAPQSLIQRFEALTNMKNEGRSFGLHWSAYLYSAAGVYDGDVTISLSSGLQVRIANDQFIVPFVDIDRQGRRFYNASRRELLFNGLSDQPATLGRYFLTAAYLMINHDEGTFTMWKANPTNKSTLVSVVDPKAQAVCQGTLAPGGGPSSGAGSSGASSSASTGMSTGTIAGIAGGICALILAVAGFLIGWCLKRRQRQGVPIAAQPPSYQHVGAADPYKHGRGPTNQVFVAEVHGSDHYPVAAEVHGNSRYVYEMDAQYSPRPRR